MVKRKAVDSLDEWLKEGELASAARRLNAESIAETESQIPSSTAEDITPQMDKGIPTLEPAELEVSGDEAASWFWSLLAQAGYELW